ncbi:MAG TPA: hypothetical protein VLY04_05830 [Bryobacteraceae bacterium]|nr:hypothetical protein [Bryobacteraceae bacterium]
MKQIMNSTKLALAFLAGCSVALCGADLKEVRSVYVLPMAHGMDQYLANRLTNEHVFQIVTDPKAADAVLTDHIGQGLQSKLDEMLAVPAPPAPAKADEKDSTKSGDTAGLVDAVNKLDNPGSNSTISHGKGTVFLVDTKSRQVVWSVFQLAKDATSRELDRTASDIVSRLKKDLSPKGK